MILNRLHYSVFIKTAWHKKAAVFRLLLFHSLSLHSFGAIPMLCFDAKSFVVVVVGVVALSSDSFFGFSIGNDAVSNASVFKSLHF